MAIRTLLRSVGLGTLLGLVASLALAAVRTRPAERAASGPSVVRIVREQGAVRLTVNGAPYFIKGAGGDGPTALLKACGGNSVRTWGVDNLGAVLDDAQRHGLMVTAGIWLGHKEHGFDYNSADQVANQYEQAREAVLKYKDHPALLMWGIGNEMEIAAGADNAAVWSAVNNIAAMVHKLDPNHPTMTVVAEIGGNKVRNIERLCPDIDVVGINSYGGGPSLADRYRAAGGAKPYAITEYGPPGVWESGKNDWGAYPELTSTEKAERYAKTYAQSIAGRPLCVGGYAFTWGHKQEATATWFGLLLPDGSRLGAVDALTEAWTGKPPANRCPIITGLRVQGPDRVDPGGKIRAALTASDPEGDPLRVDWVLQSETATYHSNGDSEAARPSYPQAITHADLSGADVVMPKAGGVYRLFAYVHDNHGGAAVANVPLEVKGGERAAVAAAPAAALPFVVYDEADRANPTYVPSGYMGTTAAIKVDEKCTVRPHSGKTCMEVRYTAPDNWGGVVWQSPANDWGAMPGGRNLTGAKRLTFWARGEKGGEVVNFLCGVLGRDKAYFDTVQEKLDKVALTADWKEYVIDLKGKDLSRIKTAFGWSLAASGAPVTFYLDDIRYE
jgi:hypothetical protein